MVVPGDKAIHLPTDTRVQILSFADGNFTAVGIDEANNLINTRRIVGSVSEFVAPTHPAVTASRAERAAVTTTAADTILSQTGEIARLQEQIADLHKKLQAAEQSRDDAAARAAELLAQPSTSPRPEGEGQGVRVETKIERNIGEYGLSRYLNDGWRVIHMQFMPAPIDYDGASCDNRDALHVVLQRTVPAAPAPQPEQRTVAGVVVPMSQQIGDDDEYDDDVPPAEPLPALNTIDGAAFTRAALNARLSPDQTMKLLNARLMQVGRAAFNAAPAPRPFVPLMGVSK